MIIFSAEQFSALRNALCRQAGRRGLSCRSGAFTSPRFQNGEIRIMLETRIAGADCLVIGDVAPPDSALCETLLLCHTLRGAGARAVTLLLPYLAYARHERGRAGESRTLAWLGKLCAASGVSKVVAVDVHAVRAREQFPVPLISLTAAPLFAREIAKIQNAGGSRKAGKAGIVLVAPDRGSKRLVRGVRRLLSERPPAFCCSKKRSARGVSVSLGKTPRGMVPKAAIIVDDMIDTGSTVIACAEALRRRFPGTSLFAFTAHGLFTGASWRRLFTLGVRRISCTESRGRALPRERRISVLPLAELLGEYLFGAGGSRKR